MRGTLHVRAFRNTEVAVRLEANVSFHPSISQTETWQAPRPQSVDTFEARAPLRRAMSLPALTALHSASRVSVPATSYDDISHQDPYLWLEDVNSEAVLTWVRHRNAETLAALRKPQKAKARAPACAAADPGEWLGMTPAKYGEHLYCLTYDAKHSRGLWQRTTVEDYCAVEPHWETVLDYDALSKAEGKSWEYRGEAYLAHGKHFMVSLSVGGSDATEWREFDVETKAFVKDGFCVPAARSLVSWIDDDTLFVATDTGEGSLTSSGWPRIVRRWERGTALCDAPIVFEGDVSRSN